VYVAISFLGRAIFLKTTFLNLVCFLFALLTLNLANLPLGPVFIVSANS